MWKKLFLVLFLVFGFVSFSYGGEVTITLEWDANTETNLGGYAAYQGDVAGGPYTKFKDLLAGTETVDFVYDAPVGAATTKYFVVDAHSDSDPPLRSGYSNEVNWTYDFLPIVSCIEFAASLVGDNITFTWKQADIERVKSWTLYVKEEGGEFSELALIEYTGQEGPQYSTTETMSVPEGEKKTFIFSLVTFTETGVFSPNSAEVGITIDKIKPLPVYNLKIKVKVE